MFFIVFFVLNVYNNEISNHWCKVAEINLFNRMRIGKTATKCTVSFLLTLLFFFPVIQ